MLSEARHPLLGRIALATVAAGAALSLSACGLPLLPPAFTGGTEDPGAAPEPEPAETEEPVETEEPEPFEIEEPVEPEDQDVMILAVGDCLNEWTANLDDTVSSVPIVDCDDPHDFEVYHEGVLDESGEYPGEDDLLEMVDEGCIDAFEDFVGSPYLTSDLYQTSLWPTEDGWEQGSRDYLCLVGHMDGSQSTGTLEDSQL
jgi:hypothetical protein